MSDTEKSSISSQEKTAPQSEEPTNKASQNGVASTTVTPDTTDIHIGGDVSQEDEKPEHREHTRSKMALLFVLGFFQYFSYVLLMLLK